MSFFIGNIEIKSKVILAPMAGITSFSYRKLMREHQAELTFSEMISDCGLIYGNKETERLLFSDNKETPFAIQLFGGEKDNLLKAIDILENSNINYDILDINLACPVAKVLKSHAGSFYLQDLDHLYDTMKAICDKSNKPVTAKIRLGFNEINVVNICKTLEKAGVKFISIHARTKKELYSGEPHYEALKDLKNEIKIPFGISGNIYSVSDAINALNITKADAVLVARGGIGNPELISNINKALNNETYNEERDINRQCNYLLQFCESLVSEKGERQAISILKGIAPKFFIGFPDSKKIRQEIVLNMNSISELKLIISKILKNS